MKRVLLCLLLCCAPAFADDSQKQEQVVEIRVVGYFQTDGTKKENRIIVLGQTAYRSVEEMEAMIRAYGRRWDTFPPVRLVLYGTCDSMDPRLDAKELEILKELCRKAGVSFTYYPAG